MPAGDTPGLITELVVPTRVPVSDLPDALFADKKVSVQMLRLDQTDPVLSGNKAFKLIPNLLSASAAGFDTVLSFGGAYSNHIHALAEAGQRFNFKTIAVIRGDDGQGDSHTLKFAVARGMRLIRVSRQEYRRRNDAGFIRELTQSLGSFYLIPEGGANNAGVRGSMQLAAVIRHSLVSQWPHEILLACGTGTTMAGLIAGLATSDPRSFASHVPFVRGIAVLKQGGFLRTDINQYLQSFLTSSSPTVNEHTNWDVETSYHWGGYARFPDELAAFVQNFERTHNILLDPVYTAKLMSALYQRIGQGLYPAGTRLLVLHTGGLQGRMPGQD